MSSPDVRWDVFLSYARSDHSAVAPVIDALRARGLRVFVDEAVVNDFDSISRTITHELARSLVLLAFYSTHYPQRRACQWELTAAYLAGQREGMARRRVLVINPEAGSDHIHPVELRDARHWSAQSVNLLPSLASKVAAHVATLQTPIGKVEALSPVRWLPAPPRRGSPDFQGGLSDLWRLHTELHPHAAPLLTGRTAASAVILFGGPRSGKTLLAEEYAVRFSAAFPGGVFWLNLDYKPEPMAAYSGQVRTICGALGLAIPDSLDDALSSLAIALEQRDLPSLWVVDGVSGDLSDATLRRLFAPHSLAATVLTTRSDYRGLATVMELGTPAFFSTVERVAAFDLQIELTTRVGVQLLADGEGGLREALDSLYEVFDATRVILHRHGPEAGVVHTIALELLNGALRPFVSRWHSELAEYEETRPHSVGRWAHERSWAAADDLRSALAELSVPLRLAAVRLAAISGVDLGL